MSERPETTECIDWAVHERIHAVDDILDRCRQFALRTPDMKCATVNSNGEILETEHPLDKPIARLEGMRGALLMEYGRTMWEDGVAMSRSWSGGGVASADEELECSEGGGDGA